MKGKIGVVRCRSFTAGKSGDLHRRLAARRVGVLEEQGRGREAGALPVGPEVSKMQAIMASHLPVFPEVYTDPEVLKANPWFKDALPVVQTARSRPVSPRYPRSPSSSAPT